MGKQDKRVDRYIAKSVPFAKPILDHLRELVHEGCPDVEETIKWGFPHFNYHGIMASMASFKRHCSFGFWKAALIKDPENRLTELSETAMGHFGRITSLADLPHDRILLRYIRDAARLNEEGISIPRKPRAKGHKKVTVPAYFETALRKNKAALTTFGAFSHSNKKDYVDWVTEAKTEATREKRLATSIAWLAEGKSRNWKYERK